jgi:hypothetical protein
MTEGTKSYLVGCHHFVMHPLQVARAWRQEYRRWPDWVETVCIFFHDAGICGRQYLSDDRAKFGHWRSGAIRAKHLVRIVCRLLKKSDSERAILSQRAFDLCAGHCPSESAHRESMLFRADKRSWLVAPMWWLWWSYYIEWHGKGIGVTRPPEWKRIVAENLKREKPLGSHELYRRHRKAQSYGTLKGGGPIVR